MHPTALRSMPNPITQRELRREPPQREPPQREPLLRERLPQREPLLRVRPQREPLLREQLPQRQQPREPRPRGSASRRKRRKEQRTKQRVQSYESSFSTFSLRRICAGRKALPTSPVLMRQLTNSAHPVSPFFGRVAEMRRRVSITAGNHSDYRKNPNRHPESSDEPIFGLDASIMRGGVREEIPRCSPPPPDPRG